MSLVTTLDPRGLRPPTPPPQTHPEERERLPAFPRGGHVDLLWLRSPSAREEAVRPFAKAFNALLWDSKLVVGWSVRTPSECARAAEDDHTVRTALLDCRFLAGDEKVYSQLADQVLRELL